MSEPHATTAGRSRALDDAPTANGSRDAWDRIAPGYDSTVTATHISLSEEGLRRAALRAGDRFLDIAAGSGALSIPAARLGARVLATDQSPVMLRLLAERSRAEELAIETQIMDGHALELDDDSFDVAGSQFGVMLFPDMPRAIREMVRVVRPGGRVLLHAFADPRRIEFLGFLVGAVRAVRPEFDGPPSDPPPLEFQLANPETLRAAFATAGLEDVSVDTISETMAFRNGHELWQWLVSSNPIVENILAGLNLSSAEREVIQKELDKLVRERAGDSDAAVLASPVNIGIGTKPSRGV